MNKKSLRFMQVVDGSTEEGKLTLSRETVQTLRIRASVQAGAGAGTVGRAACMFTHGAAGSCYDCAAPHF